MLIYNGQIIAGGGTIVLPMTRAEYEANKTVLDSADVWVDLTDEPDQVAEADQIAYSVDNVQKGMGYIGDIATKAIAKVEPSDTALYLHEVGEYFINKDGELCRTTSAISINQTITVGTNCVITSVGGEINGINSNLANTLVCDIAQQQANAWTFNIPNAYRGMLIICDSSTSYQGLYIVASTSVGTLQVSTVLAASAVTLVTDVANELTLNFAHTTGTTICFVDFYKTKRVTVKTT